jgi:hypothetical protein
MSLLVMMLGVLPTTGSPVQAQPPEPALRVGEGERSGGSVLELQAGEALGCALACSAEFPFQGALVPTKDSYVWSGSAGSNYGSGAFLRVGYVSGGPTAGDYSSLLAFDFSALPADAVILTATLELYQSSSAAQVVRARALTADWAENTVTWSNRPANTTVDEGLEIAGEGAWRRWDLTNMTNKWRAGSLANYGVGLYFVSGTSTSYRAFHSREGTNPPRLVVQYVRRATLSATADASVSQANPNINYGSAYEMLVRDGSGSNAGYALIRFDLGSMPAGSTIISASLGLRTYFARAPELDAVLALSLAPEALTASWTEDKVTWNNQPASVSRADPAYVWADSSLWNWLDVSKTVRDWSSGAAVNHGFKLKPAVGSSGFAMFYARDYGPLYAPQLIVTYGLPPCYPATSVTIGGAVEGVTGQSYTWNASILPVTATPPITYSWQATGQAPTSGSSASASYSWATPGVNAITVTVENCGSTVADTHQVTINEPPPACDHPITGLTLNGPAYGVMGSEYTFGAVSSPPNATLPITYTWQATGQNVIEVVGGVSAGVGFTWNSLGAKTIVVTAKNCGGQVQQQLVFDVVAWEELPDLTASSLWYDGSQGRIGYVIQNLGGIAVPAGHTIALYVDGEPESNVEFNQPLAPGAVRAGYIPFAWGCAGANALVMVCADATGIVQEQNEINNCVQQTWPCDQTPPRITSGPVVSPIGEQTAQIAWTTDEPCRSRLDYGRNGAFASQSLTDDTLRTNHTASLTGLVGGSTYWFKVTVSDRGGNLETSGDRWFETAPPGSDPPEIVSIGLVEYPTSLYEFYLLQATVADTTYVERVTFFLDGQSMGRDYTPDALAGGDPDAGVYQVLVSPAALGLTRADWFKPHTLQVQAYNLEGDITAEVGVVTPPPRQMPTRTLVQKIAPSSTIYIGGDYAPAGTNATVTVWAAEYGWGCYSEWIETPPPGLEPVDCFDVRQDVQRVELFLDGNSVGTQFPPAGALTTDFQVNLAGKLLGPHTLRAVATSSDGAVAEHVTTLTVARGENCVEMTRLVERVGNFYQVTLTAKNVCPTTIHLDAISDRGLVGFYPAGKAFDTHYSLQTTYDATTQRATAELDLFAGQQPAISLNLNAQVAVQYVVVPILRDQAFTGNSLSYSMGYERTGLVAYTVGADPTKLEKSFYQPWFGSVVDAVKSADYVIVTNPKRLNIFYGSAQAGINRLYATMAHLAYLKQGVLGMLESYDFETLNSLLATGWANQLHPNFKSGAPGGYVLLVGESEIIPSWHEYSFNVEWSDGGMTHEVLFSDLPYASIAGQDKHPELALGRIVGNSTGALIKPIETSIRVWEGQPGYSFDRSHAVVVSGRGIGVEETFIPTINIVQDILQGQGTNVTKIHWKTNNSPSYTYVFTNVTPGKDIVHFFGHGNVGSWGPGLSTGLQGVWPLDFDGANPFAYGTTCLSGGYEDNADSMPERFFASGAGAFIGATQVSANGSNAEAAKWFYRNWSVNETTGKVLTNLKQHFVSESAYWRLWSYEYNFYGDPKFGSATLTTGGSATPTTRGASDAPDGPNVASAVAAAPAGATATTALNVHVPDYQVTTYEGWDYVEIPDGGMMDVHGDYATPYWTVAVDHPAGQRVQAVTLTGRGEPAVSAGLQLTVTRAITSNPAVIAPVVLPAPGWHPPLSQQYDWRVEEQPDGGSRLVLKVYPFYYDSATGSVLYYQDYTFDVQTVASDARIVSLTLDRTAYPQSASAAIGLLITNDGPPQDLIVAVEIRSAVSDEVVEGLLMRTLDAYTGTVQLDYTWDSQGAARGRYYVHAELRSPFGNLLHSDERDFSLGIASAELTSMTAVPTGFGPGQSIDLSLAAANTGSMPLNGTAFLLIQDEDGAEVATFSQAVANLAPGAGILMNRTWTPPEARTYSVVGYLAYNGTGTEAHLIRLNPRVKIYLPVVVRR